jgi:hypothetical protein
VYRRTGVWSHIISGNRDGTAAHERHHGTVFEALGAHAVFGAMRFAHRRDERGYPILSMTPYTVAPDVKTFKLGVAAMLLAPPDPSERDFVAFQGYGYTPSEVRAKIQAHNDRSRLPYIPQLSYTGI